MAYQYGDVSFTSETTFHYGLSVYIGLIFKILKRSGFHGCSFAEYRDNDRKYTELSVNLLLLRVKHVPYYNISGTISCLNMVQRTK